MSESLLSAPDESHEDFKDLYDRDDVSELIGATIEVDGDDIGRIKDVDLAHDIAKGANYVEVIKDEHSPDYESRKTTEVRGIMMENDTRIALAERAIKDQLRFGLNSMAGQVVRIGKVADQAHWDRVAVDQYRRAPQRAQQALEAYDSIAQKARRQNPKKD